MTSQHCFCVYVCVCMCVCVSPFYCPETSRSVLSKIVVAICSIRPIPTTCTYNLQICVLLSHGILTRTHSAEVSHLVIESSTKQGRHIHINVYHRQICRTYMCTMLRRDISIFSYSKTPLILINCGRLAIRIRRKSG